MGRITAAASVAFTVVVVAGGWVPVAQGLSEQALGESAVGEYYEWYKGKRLYEQYCRFCHGEQGKGKAYDLVTPPPADLTNPAIQKKSDGELMKVLHEGEPGTAMGAWNWALSEEDKHNVLIYIRWLAQELDTGLDHTLDIRVP